MLDFKSLNAIQCMAASLFFKYRRLMLVLPRQEGKTELGVRLVRSLLDSPETHTALFLAKSKSAGKKAVREKFMRLFDQETFAVNTELVYRRDCETAACFMDSVDKDPDRIRGGSNHLIHWSEVAFSKLEHGVTINDVYQKVIAPSMRKTRGMALLESTMNGKNGWYELLENHKELGFAKLIVPLSTLLNMGIVTLEDYLEIKNTTHPDIFRQEYECEAVTFQGRVYPELTDELIDGSIENPQEWQRVIFAIDWGFSPSATAIVWAYVKDGTVMIFDEHYEMEEMPEKTAAMINARHEHYKIARYSATADHDPARIAELHKRKIKVGQANKSNVLGNRLEIKELLWKKKLKIHPRCKWLIRDLQAATWDPKKEGELDDGQCTWGHFDAEAALRYLVRELSRVEAKEPERNPHTEDEASAAAWRMRRARIGR